MVLPIFLLGCGPSQKPVATQSDTSALPVDFNALIQLAVTSFDASERETDETARTAWLQKGGEAAEAASKARPERIEGHYYVAVIKGRLAEQGGLSSLGMIKDIEDLGEKTAEMDPSFEEGGPYRLLAMLYAKAPPWPTSVGDMDLALEYAQKALSTSDYPMNHLIMAEVLLEDGDQQGAIEALETVLAAPVEGNWARDAEIWRPYAEKLLATVQ